MESRYWTYRAVISAVSVLLADGLFSVGYGDRPDGSMRHHAVAEDSLYKSPIQMVISRDGRRLYVVCERANALCVVDPKRRSVLREIPVGRHPFGVTLSPDERYIYVSNRWDDTVSMIDAEDLEVVRTIPTGADPHGLITDREGKTLYVVNLYDDNISLISLETFREIKRLMTGDSPFDVALGSDGRYVYVSHQLCNHTPFRTAPNSEVTFIDTELQIVADRRMLPNTDISQEIVCAPDGKLFFVALEVPRNLIPETQIYQGWMVTYGLGIVEADPRGRCGILLIDEMNLYYADPFGIVFTPDGRYAYVSCSAVDMLTVVDLREVKRLLEVDEAGKIRASEETVKQYARHLGLSGEFVVARIPTGYNPKGMAISPDGKFVYVANRLEDTVSIVRTDRNREVARIDLGGPKEMTKLRYGEYLFNHSAISFQKQLSCNTCHPENHVDGLIYDIAVDGGLGGNLVDNRTMRGVAHTGPFKWNGKNPSLARQEGPRAAQLFFRTHGFEGEERDAVVAFIESIPLPPNRRRLGDGKLSPAQRRGKIVFEREYTNDGRYIPIGNQCITCHPPPYYTDRLVHDVGTAAYFDTDGDFDTPQLNNIYESDPFLHDGRCYSLEEIWTRYNQDDLHGAANDLTMQQLNDLIEYLKSF